MFYSFEDKVTESRLQIRQNTYRFNLLIFKKKPYITIILAINLN